LALYLPNDRNSAAARTVAVSFQDSIAYLLLTELELKNAMWRAIGEKRLSQRLAQTCLGQVAQDLSDGFLQRCGLDSVTHYRKALELSEQYAASYLTRALDVLHVAAAVLLSCGEFASFDLRQRGLASAVGLKVLPRST
jgi:hypothetical protein